MDYSLRLLRQTQKINETFRTLLLEMDAKLALNPDNTELKAVIEALREPGVKAKLVPWLGRKCKLPWVMAYVIVCGGLWYIPFM